MRRLILIAFALFLVLPAPARAQETIFSHIDFPQSGTQVQSGAFYLSGWTLNCYTGQQPSAVVLWVYSYGQGHFVQVTGTIYWRLLRQDVANAYWMCGTMRPFLGWAIYLDQPLAPGEYVFYAQFADTSPIPVVKSTQTQVVITP